MRRKQGFNGCLKIASFFEWIFEAFWAPQNRVKINKNSILGVILGQDGSKEVSSWANMAPRTDFNWFLNRFWINLNWCPIDFGLIFVRSKNRFWRMFRSILNHFRLMSDRFWIDIYLVFTWIGLMFTRCWDRFSSDLGQINTDLNCDSYGQISSLTFACLQYLIGQDSQYAGNGFQTEHCFVTIS